MVQIIEKKKQTFVRFILTTYEETKDRAKLFNHYGLWSKKRPILTYPGRICKFKNVCHIILSQDEYYEIENYCTEKYNEKLPLCYIYKSDALYVLNQKHLLKDTFVFDRSCDNCIEEDADHVKYITVYRLNDAIEVPLTEAELNIMQREKDKEQLIKILDSVFVNNINTILDDYGLIYNSVTGQVSFKSHEYSKFLKSAFMSLLYERFKELGLDISDNITNTRNARNGFNISNCKILTEGE